MQMDYSSLVIISLFYVYHYGFLYAIFSINLKIIEAFLVKRAFKEFDNILLEFC